MVCIDPLLGDDNGAALTIGRSKVHARVRFLTGSIARSHCRLLWSAGLLLAQDLGSTNGTLLGDRVLSAERTPVADGDVLNVAGIVAVRINIAPR